MSNDSTPQPSFAELVKQFQRGEITRRDFLKICADRGVSLSVAVTFANLKTEKVA